MPASPEEIVIRIIADATNLRATLEKAGATLQEFSKTTGAAGTVAAAGLDKTTKSARGFFGAIKANIGHLAVMGTGFVAFYRGLVLVNAGIDATVGGLIGFDTNMRNVQSLTKQTDASLEEMGRSLLAMVASGESAGRTAVDLSDALYEVVSSGFAGADALEIIKVSAQGAAAGLTTTRVAATVLAAILNAYKLPVSAARESMDSLFRIVDLGVLRFEDLATTLGLVVPSAAALDMSLDELGAGIVVLTRQGQMPSRVMTNLNAVLTAFLKPSKQASDTAKALGIDLSAAAIQAKGFPSVLADIAAKAGDNEAALAKMFGNVRAIRAILPLAADGGQEYLRMLALMERGHQGTGATARALAEQQKSLSYQMQVLGARIQAHLIQAFRPIVIWLAQRLPTAARIAGEGFRILTAPIAGLIKLLRDLHSATGGLSTALLVLAPAAFVAAKAVMALKSFVAAAAGAMFMSAAAIQAKAAAAADSTRNMFLLAGATKAQAAAAAKSAAATTAQRLAFAKMAGWIGVIVTGLMALGAAYSFVTGLFKRGEGKKEATIAEQLADAYDMASTSVGAMVQPTEEATEAVDELGEAVQRSLIEPLGEVPKLSDEARYELEKLAKQFTNVSAAAEAINIAEKAVGDLYASLAAMNKAIEAANLALIRDALAAIGGSPAIYAEASAAVEQLAQSQEILSAEVDAARREFGALDDELRAQEKTLRDYSREAERLNEALSDAQDRIRDLAEMPIAGEAAYKQARYEIDRQIEELEYALMMLPDTPAHRQQRAEIQRQIADLRRERARIDIEASRTIGAARHQMEMMEAALTEEVAAPTLLAAWKDALERERDLAEAAKEVNERVEDQQELVDELKPRWEDAQERLEGLTDALSIVNTALDDFKTALQSAADFAVTQFNRMQEAAATATVAMQEAVVPELPREPISPALPAVFGLPVTELYRKRILRGMKDMPKELSQAMVLALVTAYRDARKLLPEAAPEELAEMVGADFLTAAQGFLGDAYRVVEEDLRSLTADTLRGVVEDPGVGKAAEEAAASTIDTYRLAVETEADKKFEGTTDYLLNRFVRSLELAYPNYRDRLNALGRLVIEYQFSPKELERTLIGLGIPKNIVNAIVEDYERNKESLKPNLELLGRAILDPVFAQAPYAAEGLAHVFRTSIALLPEAIKRDHELLRELDLIGRWITTAITQGASAKFIEDIPRMLQVWRDYFKTMTGREPRPEEMPQPGQPWPRFQHGIRNFRGGLAMVGEAGRELAVFPPKTSIASATDTARILDFLKASAAQGRQGMVFAPQIDIHAIGDRWDQMKMRILALVEEHLDRAAAEAGMNSPLIVRGPGQPRI